MDTKSVGRIDGQERPLDKSLDTGKVDEFCYLTSTITKDGRSKTHTKYPKAFSIKNNL